MVDFNIVLGSRVDYCRIFYLKFHKYVKVIDVFILPLGCVLSQLVLSLFIVFLFHIQRRNIAPFISWQKHTWRGSVEMYCITVDRF